MFVLLWEGVDGSEQMIPDFCIENYLFGNVLGREHVRNGTKVNTSFSFHAASARLKERVNFTFISPPRKIRMLESNFITAVSSSYPEEYDHIKLHDEFNGGMSSWSKILLIFTRCPNISL